MNSTLEADGAAALDAITVMKSRIEAVNTPNPYDRAMQTAMLDQLSAALMTIPAAMSTYNMLVAKCRRGEDNMIGG